MNYAERYTEGDLRERNTKFRKLRRAVPKGIGVLLFCQSCAAPYPDWFLVSNEEWERYVEPDKHDDILCRRCYDERKATGSRKSYSKNPRALKKRNIELSLFLRTPKGQEIIKIMWGENGSTAAR
jgi:hypothetical protein